MRTNGFAPNIVTMNTVLDACFRAGITESAQRMFNELPSLGLTPDRITFSTMIKGFARQGLVDDALESLEAMDKAAPWSDHSIYNAIIDAATQQAKWAEADAIYDRMVAKGIKPTIYTLVSVLKRHGREGNVQKAEEIFRSMPQQYGFKPSVQSYTCMLTVYVSNGFITQALRLFDRMKTEGPPPDAKAYEKMIFGCSRLHNPEKACELVLHAHGIGGGPRVQLDTSVLPRFVESLASRGLMDSVAPVISQLRAAGVKVPPHVVTTTLRGVTDTTAHRSAAEKTEAARPPWVKAP
jgi:pentatricopeptide repeat protein